MNMYSMGGLIQQGLGCLMGGSYGSFGNFGNFGGFCDFGNFGNFGNFGSYGMMSMNGSLFTNCFGEPNYDVMAGFAVISSVLGVANQAITSVKAQKAEYSDNKARIEEIDSKIEELNSTDAADAIDTKYNEDIKTKGKAVTDAQGAVEKLQKKYDAVKDKPETEQTTAEKELIKTFEDKKAELERKVKTANKELLKANKAKQDAIKEKKGEIAGEIDDLQKERKKLEKEVAAVDLNKADGNSLTRTSAKKFSTYYDNNGNIDKSKSYTRKDVMTAAHTFRNAVKPEDKLKAAKDYCDVYDNCRDVTNSQLNVYNIAKKYIKENK